MEEIEVPHFNVIWSSRWKIIVSEIKSAGLKFTSLLIYICAFHLIYDIPHSFQGNYSMRSIGY